MIFVIVLIITAGAAYIAYKQGPYDNITSSIVTIIAGIVAAVMLGCIVEAHVNLDAKVAKYEEQYNALVYKIESPNCRDEFGFVNKEIIDEIEDWNTMVVNWRYSRKDFWVGVFYPNNAYEQFEVIDYRDFK
jgi:hypothetical protein